MGVQRPMNEKGAREVATRLYLNLRILTILTLVFLVVLALAPFKWHNTEWRDVQKEYNGRARAAGGRPMTIGLQQIWRPEINLTDRCTSCHVGMGAAPPLVDGGPLFGKHADVGHDVARMGCTICHLGQGRATTEEAAHGSVRHWDVPMLPREHLQASCGGCHGDAAPIPPLPQVERGAYLFELHGCNACHVVDGHGGTVGPDLSGVALKGFDREWHIRHLREPTSMVENSQMMSFGHLTDDEMDDILTYLDTLIGAPDLIRGKAIAVQLGCRGCHKIGGLGGDVSVDLNEAALKPAVDYDFTHVEGPHTLANWHRQHLREPQRVAPGSTMLPYRLPETQEDALVTYILSMRNPEVGLEELPAATILARLEGKRDFPHDGGALYRVFCSACHGPEGLGQPLESLGTTVPNIRNPKVLTVMSHESLRYTLDHGRPGRFMPAWGKTGAGLSDEELETIISWLKRDLPSPPPLSEVLAAKGSVRLGGGVFLNDCSACHGLDGTGTVIAPGLTNPEFQFVADDAFIYETIARGRPGTAMPAHPHYDARTFKSLIVWIRRQGDGGSTRSVNYARRMTKQLSETLRVRRLEDYRASGSPAYGEILFESLCVGCHGEKGRGLIGPGIGNPAFLRNASDGFIAGTVLLGRSGRPMKSFGPHGLAKLEGRQVGDLIAYLRSVGAGSTGTPGYRTVQGTIPAGKEHFTNYCAACHGKTGEGLTGPALRNPAFLDAVSDGFLQATIARGRPGTAMRAWARGGYGFAELEPEEINDIVAYIRSWQNGTTGEN